MPNKSANHDLFYNLFSSKYRKYQFQLEIGFQFILKFPLIMFFFCSNSNNCLKIMIENTEFNEITLVNIC